jgi:hypothetical protein
MRYLYRGVVLAWSFGANTMRGVLKWLRIMVSGFSGINTHSNNRVGVEATNPVQ